MEIADYIIELLHQQKTVSVPGLGSFHTSRVEGYYNKEQLVFYPPSLQAQFSPEEGEGTELADLIAKNREISAASARYFIEKFVTSLKDNVSTLNVPLGNMGVFSTRRGELHFEPNSLNESYELFYGLAPAKLKRSSAFRQEAAQETTPKSPFFEKPRPVEVAPPAEPVKPIEIPEPIAPEPVIVTPVEPEPVIEEPAIPVYAAPIPHVATPHVASVHIPVEVPDEEIIEEEETRRGISIWLLLSIIIIILGVAIIGLYKYKPELFSRFVATPSKPAPPTAPVKETVTDSMDKKLVAQHDSGGNNIDTIAPKHIDPAMVHTTAVVDTFGVVIASVPGPKLAEQEAQRYIKKGFPQTEIRKKPNSTKLYLINIGTYFNLDSANANRLKVMKDLHLTVSDIRVQKYPYKKP